MIEFSRRVDVQIIKDEPLSYDDLWRTLTHDRNHTGDSAYKQYLDRFQPYRWRAVAANNEPVAHGESYFNEVDAINAAELLFGDDTTVYRMPMYGEDRGETWLRYGKTDRDHQAAPDVE
jgi:uncharacterized protein YegP (UPF0339 family)